VAVLVAPTAAGLVATGRSSPADLRDARIPQGMAADALAGAAGAPLITILTEQLPLLMGGPLLGAGFGSLGGTAGAARPRAGGELPQQPRLADPRFAH
jgi:hypothetical protein